MLVQLLDDVEDLLHQDGGQTHGGLVQHQQAGLGHQGAAHGQHLLFAAGQGACHLSAALLQPGEALVHIRDAVIKLRRGAGEGSHLQVFLHRHLEEDLPALRHQSQTLGDDLMGRGAPQALAQELDGAGMGGEQTCDGLQDGGLSGTVGADEGDYLPLIYLKGDVFDGMDGAVIDVDALYLQHGVHIRPLLSFSDCPDRPR